MAGPGLGPMGTHQETRPLSCPPEVHGPWVKWDIHRNNYKIKGRNKYCERSINSWGCSEAEEIISSQKESENLFTGGDVLAGPWRVAPVEYMQVWGRQQKPRRTWAGAQRWEANGHPRTGKDTAAGSSWGCEGGKTALGLSPWLIGGLLLPVSALCLPSMCLCPNFLFS